MELTLWCGHCKKKGTPTEVVPFARYSCEHCHVVNEVLNVGVEEWLGFNYREFLNDIKAFIDKDDFSLLKARSAAEVSLGKLSEKQIKKLKLVLKDNFEQGNSIRDIRNDLLDVVRVQDLELKNDDGETVRVIPKEERTIAIARTETTRVANAGSQLHYQKGGVEQYRWVASIGRRTCPQCERLNGQVFSINSKQLPPLHTMCRCTIVPVVDIGVLL